MESELSPLYIAAAVAILTASALGWWGRLGVGATLLLGLLAGGVAWAVQEALEPEIPLAARVADRPLEIAEGDFVSSDACRSCHPGEHASWHASYHRTMTQVVSPETVIPDMDGVELENDLAHYRFQWKDGRLYVRKTDADGRGRRQARWLPVVMSTGSHHMQLFWTAGGPGRLLRMIPFHYLVEEERWVPRRASFVTPPGRDVFGTDWNTGCILCHATQGQPRIRDARTVDTRAVEFGIACEACHGPGREHVEANRDPVRRYRLHLGDDAADPTIVNPKRLSNVGASETCGRCHAYARTAPEKRQEVLWSGYSFVPGDDLNAHRKVLQYEDLEPLRERGLHDGSFWPDGMPRGSGRELGGLLLTPCYQAGAMSCLSCHEMHPDPGDPRSLAEWAEDQLQPGMRGNAACEGCHAEVAAELQAHTHHAPDSAGSNCYNCHMGYTTLGLMKAIRNHQVTSPSVANSLETGRPNACNQCHLDETLEWTAEQLEAWYDVPVPELDEEQRRVAASVLWLLRGDAAQRALMAWSYGWDAAQEASGTAWMAPYLGQLLEDPYAVVRFMAGRSLRTLPGYEDLEVDFVADAQRRQEAHEEVRRRWEETPPDRSLLIGREGLDREAFGRLLAARNDRPVVVVE